MARTYTRYIRIKVWNGDKEEYWYYEAEVSGNEQQIDAQLDQEIGSIRQEVESLGCRFLGSQVSSKPFPGS